MPEPIVTLNEESLGSDLRELARKTVKDTLNGPFEAEADDLVGAEWYERGAEREAYRVGHYDRGLTTSSSEMAIRMPRVDRVPNVAVRAASLTVESRKRLSPRILIAEVRIRGKAIAAYGQDSRDRGRRRPVAEIRRRHGDMAELIRVMAESLVNEVMDARADEACEGGNRRNGYRERKLVTSVGTINLGIPKLRSGSYFPEDLIERCSRAGRAVIAGASEMVPTACPPGRRSAWRGPWA